MTKVDYYRHPEADGSEVPLAARVGDLVFFAGNLPWSPKDGVPLMCRPVPGYPNHWSQINRDLTYVYQTLDGVLKAADADLRSTLKLNSYHVNATDTFEGLRLRRDWFDPEGPPSSTLVLVPELPVKGATAMVDGVAVRPGSKIPRKAYASGTPGAPMPPHEQIWGYKIYSKAAAGGGFIFTSGRTNNVIGQAGAKADPHRPYQQNRPREATAVILDYLLAMIDELGAGKEHIVKADIHVSDMRFVPEIDRVWRERFSVDGPARSIFPSSFPTDNTIVEIEFVCVDPAGPYSRVEVEAKGVSRPNELVPHGMQAGDLLFLSGITPGESSEPGKESKILATMLDRANLICEAADTSLQATVKQRVSFDNLYWMAPLYDIWREETAMIPPTSAFSSYAPIGANSPSAELDLIVMA